MKDRKNRSISPLSSLLSLFPSKSSKAHSNLSLFFPAQRTENPQATTNVFREVRNLKDSNHFRTHKTYVRSLRLHEMMMGPSLNSLVLFQKSKIRSEVIQITHFWCLSLICLLVLDFSSLNRIQVY